MRLVILSIGVAATVAIFALLAIVTYALHDADRVTAESLTSFSSKHLRSQVTVAETRISLKSGATQVIGLEVSNPPGFSNTNAIHGAEITVDIDVSRSSPNLVFIRKITVRNPNLLLEIRDGQANLMRLMQALKAAPPNINAKQQELDVIVAETLIEDGQLSVLIDSLGEFPINTSLPDARLTDIGVAEDGISPAAFLEILTTFIIKSTERATRRIDIAAIATERGVPDPDIDLKSLLIE